MGRVLSPTVFQDHSEKRVQTTSTVGGGSSENPVACCWMNR